jgi:putative two-component system response regulator
MDSINENKAVGQLSEILALKHGYDRAKARQIRNAAILHDIGKQRIDKKIINKPGKLTAHEFEIIKTHTKIGVEILASVHGDLGDMAKIICHFHHEWYNPSCGGYWGVSSYYLPDYVSFVAISDVYTSLICKRPYKPAWTQDKALGYIKHQAGKQFAPELAKSFISLIREDNRVPAIFASA